MFWKKKAETDKPKKKLLLDPDQPREDVTETGGVSAQRYTNEKIPDVAGPARVKVHSRQITVMARICGP